MSIKKIKLAFYFSDYKPFHQFKDPGLIPLGLKGKCFDVNMITLEKKELYNFNSLFNLIQIKETSQVSEFKDFDVFIIYSWLSPRYTALIELLKNLGKTVIVKADSDGRIGASRGPLKKFDRRSSKWRFPLDVFKRFSMVGYAIDRLRIKQFRLADLVVIECPEAAENLSFFLSEYRREDLIKKIRVIPNPVTDDIFNSILDCKRKENLVISIGRWDDIFQKNPRLLIRSLGKFLELKSNWRAVIIGSGEKVVRSYLSRFPVNITKRINIVGAVPHNEIKKYLMGAKIFFMPSRFESFGIAAAEAVCCGCSIVGTPIEPLRFLTMQGFSGNVASSFNSNAIVGALAYEAARWEHGEVDCKSISEFWKRKLNKNNIAEEYRKILLESLQR